MIVEDTNLYERARAMAGMDVHDVYSASGLYRRYIELYNKSIDPDSRNHHELEKFKERVIKYERILRSFLVTGDIKESKRLVEEAIAEGK